MTIGRSILALLLIVGSPGDARFGVPMTAAEVQQPEPIPISGHERLGWDFALTKPLEQAPVRFRAYVDDGLFQELDAACSITADRASLTCTSPFPPMSPGVHVVSISAYYHTMDGMPEGPPSESIRVLVRSVEPPLPRMPDEWTIETRDGVRLNAYAVVSGLSDVTDLAVMPDGRVLIAERAGRVLVIRDGAIGNAPALIVNDVRTGNGHGLLALAAEPEADPPTLFALYSASRGARLVRYFLAGDRLVSRAILLDALPQAAIDPSAALRLGPDRKLYLALDDGGDPSRVNDASAFNGKVLRLNLDGTTPRDQPASSPILMSGVRRPAGLAWQSPNTFWIGSNDDGDSWLHKVVIGEIDRRVSINRFELNAAASIAGVASYAGESLPGFGGDLLVGSRSARAILRLRADGARPVEREVLLADRQRPITAIAVDEGGTIFVVAGEWLLRITAGRDRLLEE